MNNALRLAHIAFSGFLVVILFVSVGDAQTAQQIAKKAFDSTVLLVMEDSNSQPIGLGSGFFVKPHQIATNLHVVEGATSGYAKLVGQKTKYDIRGISAIDEKRDLVILNVSAFGKQPLPLDDSDTVLVGETVYAVGNPHGLEGTFSQGIISSVRTVGTDKLLQLTAPISPGSSGGPVLNERGKRNRCFSCNFSSGAESQFCDSVKLSYEIGFTDPHRDTIIADTTSQIEAFSPIQLRRSKYRSGDRQHTDMG